MTRPGVAAIGTSSSLIVMYSMPRLLAMWSRVIARAIIGLHYFFITGERYVTRCSTSRPHGNRKRYPNIEGSMSQ
jgi:hypothetical protein